MRVIWEIDADDRRDNIEAALEAWKAIREPATTATVFEVQRDGHAPVRVDLREHFKPEELGMPVGVSVAFRPVGELPIWRVADRAESALEEHFEFCTTSQIGDHVLLEGTAAIGPAAGLRKWWKIAVRNALATELGYFVEPTFRWEDDESPAGEED